jgi:hypothetical protein
MTAMIEREDLYTDEFAMEDEDKDFDLEFRDILDGCSDDYHRDAYVVDEDSYSIKQQCEACGSTWTESKDD